MALFNISVDDGCAIASSANDSFIDIDRALRMAVRAAMMIAFEELNQSIDKSFTCEVQDTDTRESKRSIVRLIVTAE
jgi:hypothetical protein